METRTLRRLTRQAGEGKGIMACITMPSIVYVGYLLTPHILLLLDACACAGLGRRKHSTNAHAHVVHHACRPKAPMEEGYD